jgi:hypothetical protein
MKKLKLNKETEKSIIIDVIILALRDYWQKHSYLRFGQLVFNIINPSASAPEIFYIGDKELYQRLQKCIGEEL